MTRKELFLVIFISNRTSHSTYTFYSCSLENILNETGYEKIREIELLSKLFFDE